MLTETSRRGLVLFAITISGLLYLGSGTPAHAACSPSAQDKPDLDFADSNCDGIDGDKAAALFVAPAGNDANDGSFGHPKATVAAAVTAALPAGKDVYVAAGIYDGKVNFLTSAGNIGVYGGYAPGTWQRSAANVTTLRAPGQVVGVAVPRIVLQLVSVQSVSGPTALNSYGVRAFGSGSVALSRVAIQTAPGAKGSDGAIPPAPPVAAPDGSPGAKSCNYFGGLGGGFAIPGVLSGGTGGAAWNKTQQWKGFDGASDPDVPGVDGGWGGQSQSQSGGQGDPGLQGTDGQGGSAALNYAAVFYQAMAGSSGTDGTRGAGGGGGAAGEACMTASGGGAGGYPGTGGKGGSGGGGSIGVFAGAGARVLVLDGSTIHTADGGKGGNGGGYQAGGPGGKGGPELEETISGKYFKSGKGGDGGYGGHGGSGGGGAGGASIGVLAINGRAILAPDTQIAVGAGGIGGISGFNGKDGASLKTAQVTTAGGSIPAVGDFDGDGASDTADACPIVAAPGGCPVPDAGGTPSGGGTPPGGTGSGGTTGGGSGTGATGSVPVAVRVLPSSSCLAKRAFTIRINARRAHLKSARLTLDGRRLKLIRGSRIWKARVNLRRSTRSRHTLTIRGTLRSGRIFKQTRRYRTCAR